MKDDKVKYIEKEPEFIVLYNKGNGEMHEVLLDYNEQQFVGRFLMDLMDKKGKRLEADERVACKIKVVKSKIAVKEEE